MAWLLAGACAIKHGAFQHLCSSANTGRRYVLPRLVRRVCRAGRRIMRAGQHVSAANSPCWRHTRRLVSRCAARVYLEISTRMNRRASTKRRRKKKWTATRAPHPRFAPRRGVRRRAGCGRNAFGLSFIAVLFSRSPSLAGDAQEAGSPLA